MLAVLFGLLSCLGDVRAAEDGKADLVFRNGNIYTADSARSIGRSIALIGNSIVAVGDDDEVAPLIGPTTKVVDLEGKLVLPGLIDTHVHPIDGAVNGTKCSLAKVGGEPPTLEALTPAIRECLAKKPEGADDDWLDAVQLFNYGFKATAQELDRIEKTRPIALKGNDGHTMWVNSRGLDLLPKGAASARERNACDVYGAPGLVVDGVGLIEEKELSLDRRASLTAAVLKDMSANGITSLMDPRVGPEEEGVWRRLYRSGRPDMRVRMALYVDEFVDDDPYEDIDKTVKQLVAKSEDVNNGKEGDVDPDFLRAGMVKVFADDEMTCPTQTAALLAPYLDSYGKQSNNSGELGFDAKKFADLVTKLDAKGLAVHVHAIGDKAVRASLDAFAAARKANGDKDNRHSIAHLQLVHPDDFPRFNELGVIADFQLLWAKREPANEKPLEPYLGPDRYRYLYPAGSLHTAGAMIVGGSDWDVSSYNPFCAFQTAVTRRGEKEQEEERSEGEQKQEKEPLNIEERILLTTAVDAYTINAAFALKQEAIIGSLEVGKRADLIVVDRDIFTIGPDAIGDTKVLMTYLDGRLVFSAPANGTSKMQGCDWPYD
jgi:predicted amidohydrolase YtcJ